MTTTTKTPRLLEAAKEFNIGKDTLVAFLTDKGFAISSNPNTRLTDKMYDALQGSYAQDKLAKRKSEEITLPKGIDNHRKQREEVFAVKREEKKEEKKEEQIPLLIEKNIPKEDKKSTDEKIIEETKIRVELKQIVKPEIEISDIEINTKKEETFSKEEKKSEIVLTKQVEPIVKNEEIKEINEVLNNSNITKEVGSKIEKVNVTTETDSKTVESPIGNIQVNLKENVQEKENSKQDINLAVKTENIDVNEPVIRKTIEIVEPEHVEIKAPKIEGPNILGKINLDELNLASRPKKGTFNKKDEKHATKPTQVSKPQVKETGFVAKSPVIVNQTPLIVLPVETIPDAKIIVSEQEIIADDGIVRPEHIEMKAPKLEGPKIIGKISLPVSQPSGNTRPDNREKRKRKRIPVDKKPEKHRTDQQQNTATGNASTNNTGNATNTNRDRNQGDRPHGDRNRNQPNRTGVGGGSSVGVPQDRNRQGGGQAGQHGGGGHHGQSNTGRNNTPGSGIGQNQPRQGGGVGRPQERRDGGTGNNTTGAGNDRSGGERRVLRVPITEQQQEIDAKAIQDKIRETQAKLTGSTRSKNLKAKYRRNKRDEMAEKRAAAENAEPTNVIQVTEFISVSELSGLLDVSFADIISKCMSLGIMVSINQRLDAEVIELVSSEFGYNVEFINLEQELIEEEVIEDNEEDLLPRAPIVTIMGHVDHGKTSLLDYIRSANVVAGEAGGITQHIGAYQVTTATGKKITFLDTPGHEAFTAMRARGAKAADVAVIVVAADDAIMPQTKEAISHAQAANLPMIFAINKIDKPGSNPEKIKEQLANMNILVEDWGGKFQSQEISAKKGLNIDLLLEKIGFEAELLELKANPNRVATGSVIEASLDKGRGYQSTILVQNGTLNQGEMIVCGQHFGKIKAMFNERGQRVKSAGPSTPVQVLGLNGAPQAGEKFKMYEDENEAKEVATHRAKIMREQGIRARKHITLDEIGRRLALGNFKELGVIIKGDFDGSVEALSDSLQRLSIAEVSVNVVHKGVGQITESDVLLATASDAIIIGFQVRPSIQAARLAEQENIEIRTYSIIYDAIDEIKSAMEGLLEPKIEKKTVCNIEVREIFKISGVGTIAGCYVLDGKMTRNTKLNIIREGIVVHTGELASLKRFKDDVKDVNAGYECGLSIKNFNDIRAADIIEGFEEVEVKRTL